MLAAMSRAVADLPDEPDVDASARNAADASARDAADVSARDAPRADLLRRLSRLPAAHPSSDAYAHQHRASDTATGAGEPETRSGIPARPDLGSTARVDSSAALPDEPEQAPANGWDAPGVAGHRDRPASETIRISPARRTHILDGDVSGGGHRHGTGHPGKTEFPADWDDGKIMEKVLDVARRPESVHQQWNGRWKGRGERDGIEVTAIITPDGSIWTAWPEEGGDGVVRNPREDTT